MQPRPARARRGSDRRRDRQVGRRRRAGAASSSTSAARRAGIRIRRDAARALSRRRRRRVRRDRRVRAASRSTEARIGVRLADDSRRARRPRPSRRRPPGSPRRSPGSCSTDRASRPTRACSPRSEAVARRSRLGSQAVEPLNVWDYERLAAELLEPGAYGYFAGRRERRADARRERRGLPPLAAPAARARRRRRPLDRDDRARPGDRAAGAGRAGRLPAGRAPRRRGRDGARGRRRRDDHVPLDARHRDAGTRSPRPARRAGSSSTSRATTGSPPSSSPAPRERGFGALVLTVDTPVLGRRERDLRTGFTIPHELGLDGAARRDADAADGLRRDVAVGSPGTTSSGSPRSPGCRWC